MNRKAIIDLMSLSDYMRKSYIDKFCKGEMPENKVINVTVLAVSTEADEDGSIPVFVCELEDGRVFNIDTERIMFLKEVAE